MKYIDNYITEKLKLRQGVQRDVFVYIVYYKKYSYMSYKTYVVINDLNELRTKSKLKNTFHRIFKCPKNLVDEFVKRWETLDDLWEWSAKNNIKELNADDINNFFYPKK